MSHEEVLSIVEFRLTQRTVKTRMRLRTREGKNHNNDVISDVGVTPVTGTTRTKTAQRAHSNPNR